MKKDWHKKGITINEKLADCYFQCVYYLSIYNGVSNNDIKYFKIDNTSLFHIDTYIDKYNLLIDIPLDDSFLNLVVEEIKSITKKISEIDFNKVEELTFYKIKNYW